MNTLDRVIQYVSPEAGLRRQQARARAEFGAYKGAETSRLMQDWLTFGGSADADILEDLPALRARSRKVIQNNGWAAGMHSTLKTSVITTGLRVESRLDHTLLGISERSARRKEREIESAFNLWAEYSDAGGRLDFFGQQTQAYEARRMNGEFLVLPRIVERPGNDVGLVLFAIESDRLDAPYHFPGDGPEGGVEIGAEFGEPVAYHISKAHPGDNSFAGIASNATVRVPAFDDQGRKMVLHGYDVQRAGQTRGVPPIAPVLVELNDADLHRQATRVAVRMAACYGLIINNGGRTIESSLKDLDGNKVDTLKPGLIAQASAGLTIDQIRPEQPGDTFGMFMLDLQRSIAMSQGVSYEIAMKDFSKPSYTALRAALIDARRFYRCERAAFVREFCRPSYRWFLDLAVFRGLVKLPNYIANRALWLASEWVSDGEDWIDPEKEVNASIKAIDANLTTLGRETKKSSGGDAESNLRKRASEKALALELGVGDLNEMSDIDVKLARIELPMGVTDAWKRYGRKPPAEGEQLLVPPIQTSETIQEDKTDGATDDTVGDFE